MKERVEDSVEELKHFNTKSFPIFILFDNIQLFSEHIKDPILKFKNLRYEKKLHFIIHLDLIDGNQRQVHEPSAIGYCFVGLYES